MVIDFVDWCGKVLQAVIDLTRASTESRLVGVSDDEVADRLLGAGQESESYSEQRAGLSTALGEVARVGFISEGGGQYRPTSQGLEFSSEPTHYWQQVCDIKLEPEDEQLLRAVNKLSVDAREDYVRTNAVSNGPELLAELKWEDASRVWVIAIELEEHGLVHREAYGGGLVELTASYNGLVWETMRHLLRKCDVFISHATDERAAASALKELLTAAFGDDIRVFVSSDYRSIGGGKNWFDELSEALRTAPVVLTLLSGKSVEKRWINFESGVGYGAGALVIPLTFASFAKNEVGFPLSVFQTRSLNDREDVLGVIQDVSGRLERAAGDVDVDSFTAAVSGRAS